MPRFKRFSDDYVLNLQDEYLDEHFPRTPVNQGWCVDLIANTYATKVYGKGVLTTDMTTGETTFEPFDE